MPRTVDRTFARLVAMKRIATGCLSIACGIGLLVVLVTRGLAPPLGGIALVIFFGGGAWTLRDGLRLRRDLAEGPPPG